MLHGVLRKSSAVSDRMKILIDMNLSPDWVAVFAKHEISAVHFFSMAFPRRCCYIRLEGYWVRVQLKNNQLPRTVDKPAF